MTSWLDLHHPEWIRKGAELLRSADYRCAEGECDNRAQRVYIRYLIEKREMWQLPDDAYRCYCDEHFGARLMADRGLRRSLAEFSIDELETLQRALKELANFKSRRAQIIEQVYADAKNKHLNSDNPPYYYPEDEELE